MASKIKLNVQSNIHNIPAKVSSNQKNRSVTYEEHDPFYVGAEAFVEQLTNGARITCKDKNGTTVAYVYKGQDGRDGVDGQDGRDGVDGQDGQDGVDGEDGVGIISITQNADYTLTILLSNGTSLTTEPVKGDTGNGIASIVKTATVGLVDTYTITFTDGTTTTYEVTNGQNGSGSVADVWVDGTSVLDGDTAKIDLTSKADVTDIPTKTSDLTNDSGYITDYTETDPTVPSWAKQANKPTYTASEVGALPDTTNIPSKTSDLTNDSGFISTETDPTVPSWAKQSTKPIYTASEVGALPDTTSIPSKTSDLTNDSGFISTETDPTVPSWAKASSKPTYTASEVGALPDTTSIPSKTSDLTNDSGFISTSGILDMFYPVGRCIETMDASFDPNVAWGGTWEQLPEGYVLLSGSANGTYRVGLDATTDSGYKEYGENSHTLTVNEMPSHTHEINSFYRNAVNYSSGSAARPYTESGSLSTNAWAKATNSGGGQAHNIMQKSVAVYCWIRTA